MAAHANFILGMSIVKSNLVIQSTQKKDINRNIDDCIFFTVFAALIIQIVFRYAEIQVWWFYEKKD
jgi:hypothetical protein